MSAAALMRGRAVLVFDLDGTLVDSAGDLTATLDLALADCGLGGLAGSRLLDLHSPLEEIVRCVLAARGASEAFVVEVVSAYRRRLAQSSYHRSAPYADVPGFLRDCRQRGQRLAVCTNKRHGEALRMLAHFDLLPFFGAVVGADSAAHAKPHPAPLLLALQSLQANPDEAVLVGDTHVDAHCARNGGVDFVWHRRGYGSEQVHGLAMAGSFDAYDELRDEQVSG